ncbi:MAG: response regulator [Lachnospiraceae bacterium]|nr:response regulator [Lachnospiraceae bacterium]
MYKIMLADDEGIVLDSLRFIIEKEFGNECEIATAKTGRSVIELAESFRPDIAVMDIQMPGINGIEAMREIRRTNSSVIFIVMSAYDKFDYAQEAIKLGVLDYVTKPMNREKMVSLLHAAMDQVADERQKRSENLIIKEKLETVVPILENGLIYNILFKEYFEDDIESYKSLLDMKSDYAYMMVMVCGDEQEGSHMTNAVGSGVRMLRNYKEIRDILKDSLECAVGTVMSNKIAVLVPHSSTRMDYNDRAALIERIREIVHFTRRKFGIRLRIGIGGVGPINAMSVSYNEAVKALLFTTGSVAHADDLPIGCNYTDDYPVETEERLFEEIRRGNKEGAVREADKFFEWMKDSDINNIRLKIIEFVLFAEKLAYENGGMTYRFESRQDYLPEVLATDLVEKLREWFLLKIGEACTNIENKRAERAISVVDMAKGYIRENYSRNISLEDVSRAVDISPYYFSRLFKEETGENFIEYLTSIRMEHAKELLTNPGYSMKEICLMIGYQDPNYFSRSFKKNVGVTPTEYRDNGLAGGKMT